MHISEDDNQDGQHWVMNVTEPPVAVPGLQAGVSYTFYVCLVTDDGFRSPYSEQWSFVMPQGNLSVFFLLIIEVLIEISLNYIHIHNFFRCMAR